MNTLKNIQIQEYNNLDFTKLKFTKTLYKTVQEILDQPNQTYKEKYEEWFEINKEHKWLVENRLITKSRTNFILDNFEDILDISDKVDNWKKVNISDYPNYEEKVLEYNRKILEQEEELYKASLHIDLAIYKWNYTVITSL